MVGAIPFEARYNGRCAADCGSGISVGDLVAFTDDGLTHLDCADHQKVERPVAVCDSCWLTKPCECDS